MPNYFKTAQNYLRKKITRSASSNGGYTDFSSPSVPNLGINSIFQERSYHKHTGFMRYLFGYDIAAHAILAVLVLIIIGVVLVRPSSLRTLVLLLRESSQPSTALMKVEEPLETGIVKPVHASEIELDATRIFSVDPGNVTLTLPGKPKKEVYGFFPYWMLETQNQISFDQLTAISLFGIDVDGGGNIITHDRDGELNPGWQMWNDPNLQNVLLRAKKQRLSVELTLKNFDNENIEKLVLSDDAQRIFIANALYLVQSKSLNGINIDFEYVGTPRNDIREGFTRLIGNLRTEMNRQIPGSTLSIDTYANAASVQGLFDIEALTDHVDSLIVMGYDIHTPSGTPGPIAPIEGQMSMLGFLQSYLEKAPADKIILAVPYYGYDWELGGVKTNHRMLSYAEILDHSRDKSIQWEQNAQAPYYTYIDPETQKERIVHFENVRSLSAKYDLINTKALKGVGIWALGYDGLNTDLKNLLIEKFAR